MPAMAVIADRASNAAPLRDPRGRAISYSNSERDSCISSGIRVVHYSLCFLSSGPRTKLEMSKFAPGNFDEPGYVGVGNIQ